MAISMLAVWLMGLVGQPGSDPAAIPPAAADQPATEQGPVSIERVDAANIELRLPARRWRTVRSVSPNQAIWGRAGNVRLTAGAQEISGWAAEDPSAARDTTVAVLGMENDGITISDERDLVVSGINGRRFRVDIDPKKGAARRMEYWVGVANGRLYEVAISGPTNANSMRDELDSVLGGLTRINADLAPDDSRKPVAPPFRTAFGLMLRWPESFKLGEMASWRETDAGLWAIDAGPWTGCSVYGFRFPPATATDEEVLAAVAAAEELKGHSGWEKKPDSNGARRWVTSFSEGSPACPFTKRVAVTITDGYATVAVGWTAVQKRHDELLRSLTDEIVFDGVPAQTPPLSLPKGERARAKAVLTRIAGLRKSRQDSGSVAELMLRVLEYERAPADVLAASQALGGAGRFKDAVRLMEEGPIPTDPAELATWWIQEARARAWIGDWAGAAVNYRKFFASGRRDDDTLAEYLSTLDKLGQFDEVLVAIDTLVGANAARFTNIRVNALVRTGREAEGLELARKAMDVGATNWQAVATYLDLLMKLKRYSDAEAECRKRLLELPGQTSLLVRLGDAQMGLGWYAKARDTYDDALKRSPGSKEIRDRLEAASRAAGQGDRSLLTSVIAPVVTPADVSAGPVSKETGVPATLDLWTVAIRFVPEKELTKTATLRYRVVTRAGIDALSRVMVRFNPAAERVCINSFRVTGPDGRVTDGDPTTYFTTDAEQGKAEEAKFAVLPAAGIDVGSLVEVVYTTEAIAPPKVMEFTPMWFTVGMPIGRAAVWLEAPKDKVSWSNSAGVRVDRRDAGVAFICEAIPAYRPEPQAAARHLWNEYVAIGPSGSTWEAEGRAYLAEIEPVIGGEIAPEVKRLAESVDVPAGSLRERVMRLTECVQKTMTYHSVVFGPRGRIPRRCEEALKDRLGDCKDHSVLLWTMLKQAGITAHLAVVSETMPDVEPVTLGRFDHMIVYVPDMDGGTFLDPTADEVPADVCAHRVTEGRSSLVLDPKAPRMVAIPYRGAERWVRVTREVVIDKEGTAKVRETVVLDGLEAAQFRRGYRPLDAAMRKKFASRTFGFDGIVAVVESIEVRGLDELKGELAIETRYALPRAFQRDGAALSGRVPAAMEFMVLEEARVEGRRSPFTHSRWRFESVTRLRAEGGKFVTTAETAERRGEAGSGRREIAIEGGTLVVRTTAEDFDGTWLPELWAAHCEVRESLLSACRRQVRIEAE